MSRRQLDVYCCVELIRAETDGHVITATGGVWVGRPPEGVSCLSGLPKAKYCPFCGAEIIVVRHEMHWSWHTRQRQEGSS